MPAKPLTPDQLEDAERLRALFKEWQRNRKDGGRPSSQMEAAADLGFGQSALSQYLRGDIPLNITVLPKFAKLLGCAPDEISPALASKIVALVSSADFSIYDKRTGELQAVIEVRAADHSATQEKTKGMVNPTTTPASKHAINHDLQIARQFSEELLNAVSEGRVTGEMLDILQAIFRLGVSSPPRGDQHHTKVVKVRGNQKRNTGT